MRVRRRGCRGYANSAIGGHYIRFASVVLPQAAEGRSAGAPAVEDRTPRRTHIFLSLVVSSSRTPEHLNHARMRYSSLHKSVMLVMFGLVLPLLRIKSTSSSMMSHPNLLGHHPQSFTSFCATPPQPHLTTRPSSSERASLTGIRIHSSTTSLEGKSGCLADSFLLTAVEQERDPRGHQPARRFSCS